MPRHFLRLLPALCLAAFLPALATAQSPFSPAIVIDDSAVTHYELDQRARLLQIFGTPGDLQKLAREQLIEDRLKQQALKESGLRLTDAALERAMEEFAERADLTLAQLTQMLASAGIAQETLRDYVRTNVSWIDYIRARYRDRVQISERDVDLALETAAQGGSALEVLLSEIIIPAPPQQAAQAQAAAERISRLTSSAAFEAEARQVSALPSRERGGRLDWTPITDYPAPLRPLILDLAPGEVTAPIPIQNGIALFQMRDIREVAQSAPSPAAIEYAILYLPGGHSPEALTEAARIEASVDTCDDLYGIAQGLPPEQLQRQSLPPAQIPQDIALQLTQLDPGEVSYALTGAEGQTLVFLMLCGRAPASGAAPDRDAIRAQLASQRLEGYAEALLAELRAAATIRAQ